MKLDNWTSRNSVQSYQIGWTIDVALPDRRCLPKADPGTVSLLFRPLKREVCNPVVSWCHLLEITATRSTWGKAMRQNGIWYLELLVWTPWEVSVEWAKQSSTPLTVAFLTHLAHFRCYTMAIWHSRSTFAALSGSEQKAAVLIRGQLLPSGQLRLNEESLSSSVEWPDDSGRLKLSLRGCRCERPCEHVKEHLVMCDPFTMRSITKANQLVNMPILNILVSLGIILQIDKSIIQSWMWVLSLLSKINKLLREYYVFG